MWINDQTLVTYDYLYEIRNAYPTMSLPADLTDEFLVTLDIYPVIPVAKPEYNWITQNCVEGNPIKTDGVWYETWIVSDATPEEVAERQSESQSNNKNQASSLLSATDWVELGDVSNPNNSPYLMNKNEFTVYRSALRSIAVNPPIVVDVWPTKPNEQWSS